MQRSIFCSICIDTKQNIYFAHTGSVIYQFSTLERHQLTSQHKDAVIKQATTKKAKKSFDLAGVLHGSEASKYLTHKGAFKYHITLFWSFANPLPFLRHF